MQCPRCGEENSDTRAACWNCFAQLGSASGGKPPKLDVGKFKEPAVTVKPETTPVPVEVAVVPSQIVEEQVSQPESKTFDLDTPVTESDFVIPGLAEPQAAEETPETKPVEESPLPAYDFLANIPQEEPQSTTQPPPVYLPKPEQIKPAETREVIDLSTPIEGEADTEDFLIVRPNSNTFDLDAPVEDTGIMAPNLSEIPAETETIKPKEPEETAPSIDEIFPWLQSDTDSAKENEPPKS
jgi:hypothetical protein